MLLPDNCAYSIPHMLEIVIGKDVEQGLLCSALHRSMAIRPISSDLIAMLLLHLNRAVAWPQLGFLTFLVVMRVPRAYTDPECSPHCPADSTWL